WRRDEAKALAPFMRRDVGARQALIQFDNARAHRMRRAHGVRRALSAAQQIAQLVDARFNQRTVRGLDDLPLALTLDGEYVSAVQHFDACDARDCAAIEHNARNIARTPTINRPRPKRPQQLSHDRRRRYSRTRRLRWPRIDLMSAAPRRGKHSGERALVTFRPCQWRQIENGENRRRRMERRRRRIWFNAAKHGGAG